MKNEEESLAKSHVGYDEMNLAEFGIASASERHLDGKKTVLFEDTVWDKEQRKQLPRKLAISGSDLYGLPTAKDDDVLLACVQLSSIGGFGDRHVEFSRYELLKLLRWGDSTRNYRRLSKSLRRWAGLTVFSNRAFYDHARKSWVNRDFGVLDNLVIYEREEQERAAAPAASRFSWNQVFFDSFQAGYLKRLDWDLYCRLESPVAKRLYRFLDKRFYRGGRVEIDLHELAVRKVRLAAGNNTAHHKRSLLKGIAELEREWELKPATADERFRREARGKWMVVFERKRASRSVSTGNTLTGIAAELAEAGVTASVARQLAESASEQTIRTMLALHAYYQETTRPRGAGFLVESIRDPASVRFPPDFRPTVSQSSTSDVSDSRGGSERFFRQSPMPEPSAEKIGAETAFQEFWSQLGSDAQADFFKAGLATCRPFLRDGYRRGEAANSPVAAHYRMLILREHFLAEQERGQM